ncbi:MAG: TonB-dependent receptor, partial [Proteobacteria bacterium]
MFPPLASGDEASANSPGSVIAPPVEVVGHYETAIGTSDASSQGSVTSKLIEDRPILRPGEILEFVPGMVVTQHSGDGKANQYFLRGYNLDHGTDFATYVEGMPVNMPTNAHGQGYSDLNFMIPELVDRIDFKKGPYFAEEGDFASAGSAHFRYFDSLPKGFVQATVGEFGYERGVVAASPHVGNGHLLLGFEYQHNNGPWQNPEGFNKFNGVLRLTQGDNRDGFSIDAMGYNGHWDSTDQIPLRAVDQGIISRFGAIDPTDGGDSSRYSLSFQGHHALNALGAPQFDVDAYIIRYSLDLFSNFTFFLNDPVNGDQFEQSDRRTVYGLRPTLTWGGKLGSADTVNKLGLQMRYDDISRVALYNTVAREITSITREDDVKEGAVGLFGENTTQWTPWFRSIAGVRIDYYNFDVNSS